MRYSLARFPSEALMAQFEYRVVPAPLRGIKSKGARTPEDRFALALAEVMNDLGRDGWEYVRCDTLPSEERTGLTGRTTVYRNMLVFRREHATTAAQPAASVAAPTSFAARMAATLRPGASGTGATAGDAAVGSSPTADPGDPPAAPVLGPADRGQAGAAPRLVVDRDDADARRLRPDGSAAV
jgi:hypothetical protein